MNELFLGFPIWYYNVASVLLSFAFNCNRIKNRRYKNKQNYK